MLSKLMSIHRPHPSQDQISQAHQFFAQADLQGLGHRVVEQMMEGFTLPVKRWMHILNHCRIKNLIVFQQLLSTKPVDNFDFAEVNADRAQKVRRPLTGGCHLTIQRWRGFPPPHPTACNRPA